ncbi:DUF7857 domain-containing protein [Halomarina litorea]|uniref:DUF7857 domain-containing protein n=1 Tax=Halomarina litorea TaxID=2961595 RepID=UPI0020C24205|nr:hypothetical protein [Halomarina sp. BCD28]
METPTDVEWTTTDEGDVTLVSVVLRSERPRRVRVRPTRGGPVWPPRSDGVPVEGWDDGTFEGVVDGRRALGFATPARDGTTAGPVDVTWLGPADPTPAFERHPDVPPVAATPAGVVQALGDPAPPRDAVPNARDAPDGATGETTRTVGDPAPEEIDLAAVERRVELAEALAAAGSLAEATEAVERAGGLAGVHALSRALDVDGERLERAGHDALADRVRAVSVPVGTLERIA